MDRLLEFAVNHYILVSTFFGLIALLMVTESRRGGMSISAQALVNLMNQQDAQVIDVRPESDYKEGHITGAKNIPFTEAANRLAEFEKMKDKPIVLVCAMGQHAGSVGRQLRAQGIDSIYRLAGGISTWQNEKLPLVKGKKA